MNLDTNVVTIHNSQSNFYISAGSIYNFLKYEPLTESLAKNYTPEKLKLEESIAITLITSKNKIIGFSTLLHRDIFGNAVRCLNRFYKSPHYRFATSIKNVTPETQQMIQQQSDIAKHYNYDIVFMSRETKTGQTSLKHYPQKFLKDWILSPDFHLVCENQN